MPNLHNHKKQLVVLIPALIFAQAAAGQSPVGDVMVPAGTEAFDASGMSATLPDVVTIEPSDMGPRGELVPLAVPRGNGACACSCRGRRCRCGLLSRFLVPSDQDFCRFISPMTNPLFAEDPRTLTEIRPIFIYHKVPLAAGSKQVNVFAAQIRLALTDRTSIIATKDGFITSDNPLIEDGWADVTLGLKQNLFKNPHTQRLLSAGLTFEIPAGSDRALQGNGDGEFHLFLTGGTQVGRWGHWISASGIRLPSDTTDESQVWYWSNHFDRQLARSPFYGLLEFNWYHWMRSGRDGLPGIEGLDLINLGSPGVAGNDIVTGAFGLKYKPSCHAEFGVAWEVPLTERRDILDNRLTVDWIFRY